MPAVVNDLLIFCLSAISLSDSRIVHGGIFFFSALRMLQPTRSLDASNFDSFLMSQARTVITNRAAKSGQSVSLFFGEPLGWAN